ncbi:MAG: hypothetical protein ACR2JI_05740 [Mycobacterium sp.]
MRNALKDNRRPLSIEWNYLGLNLPETARSTDAAIAEAQRAISRTKPDVLIAVGDEANDLVARNYIGRKTPRILYVAIDRPPADYGYPGAPNVSGIANNRPWAAVRDAVATMFADRPATMAVIGAKSEAGEAQLAQISTFDWGPVRLGRSALVSTAPAWREAVGAAATADILLVTTIRDLPEADGTTVSGADLVRWTQQNSRPLPIGNEVEFVTDGGALSLSPPPDSYGKQAIALALDWLDERRTPGPPAPVSSDHFEVAMRQGLLAQRGLSLPAIYPEAARENGTLFP